MNELKTVWVLSYEADDKSYSVLGVYTDEKYALESMDAFRKERRYAPIWFDVKQHLLNDGIIR